MDFLRTKFEIGMPVYLYGEDVSRSELIPDLVLLARQAPQP